MFETLESRSLMSVTLPSNGQPVAVGDVNGDGRTQVVTAKFVGSANGGVWKTSNGTTLTAQPDTTQGIIAVLIAL